MKRQILNKLETFFHLEGSVDWHYEHDTTVEVDEPKFREVSYFAGSRQEVRVSFSRAVELFFKSLSEEEKNSITWRFRTDDYADAEEHDETDSFTEMIVTFK